MLPVEIFYMIIENIEEINDFYNLLSCCKNSAKACSIYRNNLIKKYDKISVYFYDGHCRTFSNDLYEPKFYVSISECETIAERYKNNIQQYNEMDTQQLNISMYCSCRRNIKDYHRDHYKVTYFDIDKEMKHTHPLRLLGHI